MTNDTKESMRNTGQPQPWRVSRRSLLKAAALSGAGVASIGIPSVQGAIPAAAKADDLPPAFRSGAPIKLSRPAIPSNASSQTFSFRTTMGYEFDPIDTSVASNYVGNYAAIAQLTGTPTGWTAPLYLPDGALLLGAFFSVLVTDSNQAHVVVNDLANGTLGSAAVSPSSSFQTIFVPLTNGPVTIDNVVNAYFIGWVPGTSSSAHQLRYGQVGFAYEDRLITFPTPRRVYDGNANPEAPGNYGPIDATAQVSTSGWPGGPSGVPAGAQAAFCAVQSYTAGVMTLYPDGSNDPGIANWSGTANGPLNLMYMLVPLSSAGKFRMHKYFTGQAFVDAWGYLL